MIPTKPIKAFAAAAALAAMAGTTASAADLTIALGTVPTPFSVAGLYQIVQAGNPFSDTPRTVMIDEGGTVNNTGWGTLTTGSNFQIAETFTTTAGSSFNAEVLPAFGDAPILNLYKGTALVATGASIDQTIGTGSYTFDINGTVNGSKEAEGSLSINDTIASSSPTPEPATWAVMVAGAALAGGMLRRRRAASPQPV
jgi:opacity protein-like surface antigen